MNYYTDKPITTMEEDLLGRASFSQQLGKAIYDYKECDSLVIGLFGGWGSGKTSIANMALTSLEALSKNDENKPVIVKFAPWNYSDKDNLICQFFDLLKSKLNIGINEKVRKKIGKALDEYSSVFDLSLLIPNYGGLFSPIVKTVAKNGGKALSKPTDLVVAKRNLENELIRLNKKIIVLIDDIDRLSNSQIRDIFQLVKQVGDLPNITYVLVMDREIVNCALSKIHDCDGSEYLEKIIQIPFEIPELKDSSVHDIFFDRLNSIIQESANDIEIDQKYWSRVFRNCIAPYINTLRDVNRVINVFRFKYSMLYKEISFEDMIGITTLEVLEPDLYKWIVNNKESVCGSITHSYFANKRKPEEWRNHYIEEFEAIGIDVDKAIKCVSAMFPVFAKDVNEYFYDGYYDSNVRAKMRVAQEDRFDCCFSFNLEPIKVSRNIINNCISFLDKDGLSREIETINDEGDIVYFLEEILANIDRIPQNRIGIIVSVLLENSSTFLGETEYNMFSISASYFASVCIEEMLTRLKTLEERFLVYRHVLSNSNKHTLGTMASEIYRIENAYGRINKNAEKSNEQIISLEQLKELEKLFLEKADEISNNDNLLDIEGFCFVLYLWNFLDSKEAHKNVDKLLTDDVNKLRFISKFATRWRGSEGAGWSYNSNNYTDFVSDKEIYELIQKFDKSNIDRFDDIEQIKLASFVICFENNKEYHVTEIKAKELVDRWKQNISDKA